MRAASDLGNLTKRLLGLPVVPFLKQESRDTQPARSRHQLIAWLLATVADEHQRADRALPGFADGVIEYAADLG